MTTGHLLALVVACFGGSLVGFLVWEWILSERQLRRRQAQDGRHWRRSRQGETRGS